MLSKLKISSRVLILGVLPLLMLLLVLAGAFWSAQQKDKLFNQLYDDHLAILSDVMAVQQILQQTALQDIRKYRTGWASAEATEQVIKQHMAQAQQHWQGFVQSRPMQDDSEFYTELDQAFAKAVQHYGEWISYAGSDALLVRILNESTVNSEIELRITGFTQLTEAFIQQQLSAAVTVRDRAQHFTGQLVRAYLLGGLALVLMVSALIWAIQRSVCRPLLALRDLLMQVVTRSDLSLRANDKGNDELAQAAGALNQMMQHFEQLVAKLGHSAVALNQQAGQVYDISTEVNQSAAVQARQAQQLAAAAEQMSSSVQQVAQNAGVAAQAAVNAEQLCQSGHIAADKSAAGITALATQLQHSVEVVSSLQQGSGQISGVLEVIGKISEQTNLLALNAAIEAARAGEAGRGFSVVADEVRTLSANTKQATESINGMISKLQQQASDAVQVMQQAYTQANTNVQLAQDTGSRFNQLASAVEHISSANAQIHTATAQQQVVSQNIAATIHQLNDEVSQLSNEASRSASASEQLTQLAAQLNNDWKVFAN